MFNFDAATAGLLNEAYEGGDFRKRRAANADLLAVRPGDRVLDIGCGAGHLTLELSRAVGKSGQVIGVDPSPEMLRAAAIRCEGRTNVAPETGTANDIPVQAETIDRAVSVQVFEYLQDVPGALAEAHRVLRPGGRLVVGDIHFDSLVWFSDEPDRMRQMTDAWDGHLHERGLPAVLPGQMTDAGFEVDTVRPLTLCDTEGRADGLARMLMILMAKFALDNALLYPDAVQAWTDEQNRLIDDGRFFFSITHYVVAARKR